MLEDALLNLTNRGEIVIDPFLGSGSTLIAADNTGRVCRGVELDPLYVDVIVRGAPQQFRIIRDSDVAMIAQSVLARAVGYRGGPASALPCQLRRAIRYSRSA